MNSQVTLQRIKPGQHKDNLRIALLIWDIFEQQIDEVLNILPDITMFLLEDFHCATATLSYLVQGWEYLLLLNREVDFQFIPELPEKFGNDLPLGFRAA